MAGVSPGERYESAFSAIGHKHFVCMQVQELAPDTFVYSFLLCMDACTYAVIYQKAFYCLLDNPWMCLDRSEIVGKRRREKEQRKKGMGELERKKSASSLTIK